jgi:tetratricopeptide (TPR) repeat protein
MELGVMERPDDVRLAHYLGREYYFHKKYDEAIIELKRHLSLPNAWWEAERASSMRYIALCHKARNERHEECRWLMRACAEAPNERDSWAALSNHYTIHKNWSGGYFAALQALSIKERPMHYITSALVWGMFVHDLAGTNAYYLDLKAESKKHYEDALNFDPNNERLKNNLRIIGKI